MPTSINNIKAQQEAGHSKITPYLEVKREERSVLSRRNFITKWAVVKTVHKQRKLPKSGGHQRVV